LKIIKKNLINNIFLLKNYYIAFLISFVKEIYPKKMRIKITTNLFFIFVLLLFCSCATKITFEPTCLTCVQSQRINCKGSECPETIMVGGHCYATFDETGERFNIDYILGQEKIAPVSGIPITLAKIRGRYFITGSGFKKL
jgi:hypothetical protein